MKNILKPLAKKVFLTPLRLTAAAAAAEAEIHKAFKDQES